MAEATPNLLPLLKSLRLFYGLDDEQLALVASVTTLVTLKEGEELALPTDRDYPFYMVASGKVDQTLPAGRGKTTQVVLKKGDLFGADLLLMGRRRYYLVKARMDTQLLVIEAADFATLLRSLPGLKTNAKALMALYRIIRRKTFDWLNEDETVHLVMRVHPAYLFISLMKPLVVAWLGFIFFLVAAAIGLASISLVVEWIGGAVMLIAVGWAIWITLDWENDYYIVTDQRVVWLERVYYLYDSRQEGPLGAIKSEEVNTTFWGRSMGYGDVTIRAFMGQVVFRNIGQPHEVRDLIDILRKLAVSGILAADRQVMESVIRRKIEAPGETEPEPVPVIPLQSGIHPLPSPQAEKKPAKPKDTTPMAQRFRNYFKTRLEEGDVVTYRKHSWILLVKTFVPDIVLICLAFLTVYLFIQDVAGTFHLLTPLTVLLTGGFLMTPFALWWLYEYVDWRNDIYQITSDRIIDSERKPLGTEFSKSAPLENIIGLDYTREGFLGVLLNMGNVILNTGTETNLIFYTIHDPARAQRDVYNHMYEFQRKKQLTAATKEWEQVSDWLAAYHRQAGESLHAERRSERRSDEPPQN
jgi:hypothetical protein